MPEPPATLSPAAQARAGGVQARASTIASAQSALPPASEQVEDAQQAVTTPAEERAARAQGALVEALGQQPEPSPEIEALCERIRRVIREKRPPDEDSLVEAQPDEMAREAGRDVGQGVQGEVRNVEGSYQGLQQEPAPAAAAPREELPAPPEVAATPPIQAERAAPDPVPAEDTSLDADVAANRQRMDEAGMSSEPAQLVQSGPIAEARSAQGDLERTAAEEPARVQAQQAAALNGARNDMARLQEEALEALQSSRAQTATGARGQQQQMVGSEEQMRSQASARAQAIFDEAQRRVETLLQPLTDTAMRRWDTGIQQLSDAFKNDLRRVKQWIDDRHAGVLGTIVAGADYVFGMPRWVTEEYDRAERAFGDGACELARDISREVNGVIATCEAIVDRARADIAQVFEQLPASLQEWAAGEQARLGQSLDGLRDRARQQRDQFNQQLIQRASQAVQEVRQEIHGLRQRARGLVGRIADAVNAFLRDPARFIIEGLLSLLGIQPSAFWAVVARIRQVIADIANDPLGFAGKLLSAVGDGFRLFFDNIGGHLLRGLIEWLFSGLGGVGVQIPRDLSLRSIVTFFLQLMGITWDRIRRLIARRIGERNVALLERAWEFISTLVRQGPAGIFEMIKDRLNPQQILTQVLTAARDALIEAVITRVTARILMMFNPAGAILQAIEAIYRVLKWVFQNAARLFSLVETIVNGISDLLRGNTAGMARAIDQALARLIAPVISFLADYLGVGGLPLRIRGVIERMQNWVEGILDRVIGWIADQVQRLMRAVGLGREQRPSAGDTELGETVRFTAGRESHRMWVDVRGTNATLMIASTPMTLEQRLADWNARLGTLDDRTPVPRSGHGQPPRQRATNLLIQAGMLLREANTNADQLAAQSRTTAMTGTAPAQPINDDALEAHEHQLARVVSELFWLFGDTRDQGALTDRFRRELAGIHPSGRQQVDATVQALNQGAAGAAAGGTAAAGGAAAGGTIADWPALTRALSANEPAKRAVSNPLTQDHTFGVYGHNQAIARLRAVTHDTSNASLPGLGDAKDREEDWLRARKPTFNEGNHPYHEARPAMREELFNGALEPQANTALTNAFVVALRQAPPPVAQELRDAFPSPSTVVASLLSIIRGGKDLPTNKVDLVRLNALWSDPATGSANREFLADRLRRTVDNRHEWIPVSRLIAMVNRDAREPVPTGMRNPCRWIKLQDHLRVDTEYLVFKWDKARRTEPFMGQEYTVLQGHPGAVRLVGIDGAPAWEQDGEHTFHRELFEIIGTAMDEDATIETLIARLKAKCEAWVWNGEIPTPEIHPALTLRSGLVIADDLSASITEQQARLRTMLDMFDNILATVAADTR